MSSKAKVFWCEFNYRGEQGTLQLQGYRKGKRVETWIDGLPDLFQALKTSLGEGQAAIILRQIKE